MSRDLEKLLIEDAAAVADLRAHYVRLGSGTPVDVVQVLGTFAVRGRAEDSYARCAIAIADVGADRRVLLIDYYAARRDRRCVPISRRQQVTQRLEATCDSTRNSGPHAPQLEQGQNPERTRGRDATVHVALKDLRLGTASSLPVNGLELHSPVPVTP